MKIEIRTQGVRRSERLREHVERCRLHIPLSRSLERRRSRLSAFGPIPLLEMEN